MKINWYVIKYLFDDSELQESLEWEQKYQEVSEHSWDQEKQLEEKEDIIRTLKLNIQNLIKKEWINIDQVKDWYEARYGYTPWHYEYQPGKRVDVKHSLKVSDAKPVKELLEKIIETMGLEGSQTPEEIIEGIAWYFTKRSNWTYINDSKLYNTIEYWAPADKSAKTLKGDCDDLAILMHNLIYYAFQKFGMGEEYWRLKLAAGGTLVEGHAFNIWLAEDGEWYVLESTLDLAGSLKKTWLKTPIIYNNLYQKFYGFARKDRSWQGTSDSLDSYEKTLEDLPK